MNNLVIGIDGGGTRTRARLANLRGETLATTVIAVARRLDFRGLGISLAMTGGLLLKTEAIRARLLEIANARGYRFSPPSVHAPVAGAVRIAIQRTKKEDEV